MSRYVILAITLSLLAALCVYTFYGLRSLIPAGGRGRVLFTVGYMMLMGLTAFSVWYSLQHVWDRGVRNPWTNFFIGFWFSVLVGALVFSVGLVLQDGGRGLVGLGRWIAGLTSGTGEPSHIPSRRNFLTAAAAGLAAVPFLGMLYGITRGKYNYVIRELELVFPDLPDAFDGFKIGQISDIHSGSWDSIERVRAGVDTIRKADPDILLFTGDLVNFHKDEIDPYIELFRGLEMRAGSYSILGNHDYYGAYRKPAAQRAEYMEDMKRKHAAMGWELLLDEHRRVERGGQSIILAGVQNWGHGPFPKEGDLKKTLRGVDPDAFTVLMSHDPSHWTHEILPHPKQVHLTLSGHTHGMQFGIRLRGLQWSPIQYRYKHWLGIYDQDDQYLHVNPGFGFLGFPGRVGIWPEVTVITLRSA